MVFRVEPTEEVQTVGFARICLIADGTVLVDAGNIDMDNATANKLKLTNNIDWSWWLVILPFLLAVILRLITEYCYKK